jgi:hypothetical protein
MHGYVIGKTPFQLDQREKVEEHYTLVKHYLGKSLLLNAAQCGSYAHQLCKWWTNLPPLSVLQLALKYTIKDPACMFIIYWMIRTLANQLQGKRNLLGFLQTQ